MLNLFTGKKLTGGIALAIFLAITIVLSGCSDKATENILRIHVSSAFDASKTITATGLS